MSICGTARCPSPSTPTPSPPTPAPPTTSRWPAASQPAARRADSRPATATTTATPGPPSCPLPPTPSPPAATPSPSRSRPAHRPTSASTSAETPSWAPPRSPNSRPTPTRPSSPPGWASHTLAHPTLHAVGGSRWHRHVSGSGVPHPRPQGVVGAQRGDGDRQGRDVGRGHADGRLVPRPSRAGEIKPNNRLSACYGLEDGAPDATGPGRVDQESALPQQDAPCGSSHVPDPRHRPAGLTQEAHELAPLRSAAGSCHDDRQRWRRQGPRREQQVEPGPVHVDAAEKQDVPAFAGSRRILAHGAAGESGRDARPRSADEITIPLMHAAGEGIGG